VEPSILWIVGFIDAGGLWDAYKTSAYNTDIGLGPNLSPQTMAKDNFVYSWGFGLRVQIPVMPIRLYMAQRVIYAGKDDRGQYHGFYGFKKLEGLEFVFGIGDFRY
jgi:outer membrane protein insertion porin family